MAEAQQTEGRGTYLYAVVPADSVPQLDDVSGIEQGKVFTVKSGELAAVVSEVPTREELRPERRNLSAHQQVLDRATDASSVILPVSFGTIAESPDGVRSLLERHQQEFSDQMKRVGGKVEMRVRISYATEKPNIYEFLVSSSPELREFRDRLFKGGRQPTREEKIDLGQKFDAVLTSVREDNTKKLEDALKQFGEIRRNPPRNEKELVNLAALIPKGKRSDFEAAVQEAGRLFPDSFLVQEFGPAPPYDFVELHVKQE